MRRTLLLIAALAVPLSAASMVVGANPASAAVVAKITCTKMTGNVSSTITVSSCTGGHTGGKSKPIAATALAAGGTLHWVSGGTTTIKAPTLTSVPATNCPGFVAGGSNNPQADKFVAVVSADKGDHIKVPGQATGAICISHTGAVTALKPVVAT
jgi:hypothetical protein